MMKLTYSAFKRCVCGEGLAYISNLKPKDQYWSCSAYLLGIHLTGIRHVEKRPVGLFLVMSELNPRAKGATTRPMLDG